MVLPGSLQPGEDRDRRGFDVEAEVSPGGIVAIANLFFGAGYALECITAVDQEDFRELWYQFNMLRGTPHRHLLRMPLDETEQVPSISHVFGSADWFEREAFDMMGVQVQGHPNLKRLLLPEDSDFHPLRRDQCIDDELRETRAARRTKRLAALEKERARAEAEQQAAAEEPTEEAAAPLEATTSDGPGPVDAPTDDSAPAISAADAPTDDSATAVAADDAPTDNAAPALKSKSEDEGS